MDLSLNDGSPSNRQKELPSKTGENSSGVPLWHRQRKVSAVRDFPNGCEKFAQQFNGRSGEVVSIKPIEIAVQSTSPVLVNLVVSDMSASLCDLGFERKELMVNPDPEEALELTTKMEAGCKESLKAFDKARVISPLETLGNGTTGLLKNLDEKDFLDPRRRIQGSELKNVMENVARTEKMDMSSCSQVFPTPNLPILAEEFKGTLPKVFFHQRRISGSREFPPGCGRTAPHLSEEERKKLLASFQKKGLDQQVPILEHWTFEARVISPLEALGIGTTGLLENLHEKEFLDPRRSIEGSGFQNVKENVAQAEKMDMSSSSQMFPTPNMPILAEEFKETLPKVFFRRRRISGSREFPPGCGRTAPHLSEEECNKLLGTFQKKGLNQQMPILEHSPFEDAVWSDDKQVHVEGQVGIAKSKRILSSENGAKVVDRFEGDGTERMRKEIQVGKSSEIKSKWKDAKEISVKPPHKSSFYQVDLEPQTIFKRGDTDSGVLGKTGKEPTDKVGDKSPKRTFNDTICSINSLQRENPPTLEQSQCWVIMHALMAAPNCPWRRGKRAFRTDRTNCTHRGGVKKH